MRYVFLLMLILCVSTVSAEILFEDDFEGGEIDNSKWAPTAGWKIANNDDGHDILDKKVLEVMGGDVGLSIDEFPEEFDYYADFKAMQNGLTGFVFHGQDGNNVYMHQVSTGGSGHTPQHIRWHRRVNGGWGVEPGAFGGGVELDQDVWYRVKFEVRRGYKFKAYVGDIGSEDGDLTVVSEWTDGQKSFEKGKIGVRMSGGEQAQYDNIVVATPDFDIFPVEPKAKLSVTWGNLKRQ